MEEVHRHAQDLRVSVWYFQLWMTDMNSNDFRYLYDDFQMAGKNPIITLKFADGDSDTGYVYDITADSAVGIHDTPPGQKPSRQDTRWHSLDLVRTVTLG
jgi:hypothetical protein